MIEPEVPIKRKEQMRIDEERKQRKEAEVSHDESEDEDHVPTPSSDPLPSEKVKIWRAQKIGSGRRVKSPMEKDGLGAQEDESKQGRMIEEIDQNAKIALDDETQGRTNDDEIVASTTDVTEDEVTMAQALAALKSTKPKVVVQEQEISTTIPVAATIVTTAVPTPRAKEVPIKRKEQMRIDEEYARKLEVKEQEAARLSRAQQNEEANNY
nr:hypothetical protein [Tanacetum cinerariifolium]